SKSGHHGYAGLRAVEKAGGCAIPPLRWDEPDQALGLEHLPREQVVVQVSECIRRQLAAESPEPRAAAAAARFRADRPRAQPAVELVASGIQGAPSHTLEQARQTSLSDELTFARLAQPLAMLIGARQHAVLRAWVPRCGTGQEAYALAMLLLEHLEAHGDQPRLRVFGTDVDPMALRVAHTGAYPDSTLRGLSAERRRSFFTEGEFAPRVRFELRRHVLFAHHDVHGSAPLSRIDLLSAHHLLRDCPAQLPKSLLETFHFALRDGGWLLVGPQHAHLVGQELFETIDADCDLFRAHRFTVLGNASRRRAQALRTTNLPASR